MASLTLKQVSKFYGEVVALSGIDLQVEEGEFCVLLGPSGCGKSTLLSIVAGLLPQDEGTVWLDGRCVDRLSPRQRDVAVVFQNYALYPHMSVAQNLGFGLRMRGVAKKLVQNRIEEIARLLGIEHLLKRKPRELSGGQRQRVAMGRALVRRPKIFLLDEPLSNLDARLRDSVRLELKRLHRQLEGTVLYVTHDQLEAMTLGDRVVVMSGGRVHQADRPEVIYRYPADTFVATFIGSPQMNLYRGTVVRRGGSSYFKGRGFELKLAAVLPGLQEEEVELGMRPEDLGPGTKGDVVLETEVELLSDVGSEKYLHARLGQESLTARLPAGLSPRLGQRLLLSLDAGRLHLFHRGRRLGASGWPQGTSSEPE